MFTNDFCLQDAQTQIAEVVVDIRFMSHRSFWLTHIFVLGKYPRFLWGETAILGKEIRQDFQLSAYYFTTGKNMRN